jgi:TPR repeat protein
VITTIQKLKLSGSHSDSLGCLDALAKLAQELGLYLYDFQKHCSAESDVEEFQRRTLNQARSEEEQTFLFALEAATKGSLHDMHLVGSCYRYGTGVTKDVVKAIDWYERAAESGMRKALVSLAEMYREDLADDLSLRNGVSCLQRAVAAGSSVALAMLAEWTREGIGMSPDVTASVTLWRELLEIDACVAAFELAKAYEHGQGVDRSTSIAIDYFRQSREAGHPEALRNLRRLGAEK